MKRTPCESHDRDDQSAVWKLGFRCCAYLGYFGRAFSHQPAAQATFDAADGAAKGEDSQHSLSFTIFNV